jgi:LPS-assembly protein
MARRILLLITALAACHLLLAPQAFTNQLPQEGEEAPATAGAEAAALPAAPQDEEVTIRAREQEKAGDVFQLRGEVEIRYRDFIFRADQVTYDTASGQITATGKVSFEGGPNDESIQADRALYNVRTEAGEFHNVSGTTGLRFAGRGVTLTTTNPLAFRGRLVEKLGRGRYIVHDGQVTSCQMPNPKWTFNATRVVVDVDDRARIYNATFRVKKVPVFYFPFAAHPVGRLKRQSGFLTPTFGTSSRKGIILGESFYWAVNRSLDLSLGAEYWSSRGWAQHGEMRARPNQTTSISARYFGVLDRGLAPSNVDQGGQDVHLTLEAAPFGFRGVANLNYLSSFVFRLAFTEAFSQAVNSEVKSVAFLSQTVDGFSFNTYAARYQNFQSTARGDLVTILHAPAFEVGTVDRRLARTPLYWSFDAAVEAVSRKEPSFVTNDLVGRFDVHPRASLPLHFGGWTVRPEVALRNTYYTQRRLPVGGPGVPDNQDVNRRAIEASLEVRPPGLARIFSRPVRGRTLKHVIEPRFTYRFAEGVENFANIIRFDSRDILSDTSELEYAIVNRLYAKRTSPKADCVPAPEAKEDTAKEGPPLENEGFDTIRRAATAPADDCGPGEAREIVTWELAQKYFFLDDFGGAVVNGRRNVLTTTASFAGIAFLTEPRRLSPLISRLRVRAGPSLDAEWHFDYDFKNGRVNASTALLSYRIGEYFLGGSHAYFQAPGEIFVSNPIPGPDKFNQIRVLMGYGHPNKRGISTAANIGFDYNLNFLQYSAFQGTYNWDCCGISMEYRRFALGSVRNENQFRFAFTLANIGSFGNLRRRERIY